MSRENAESLIDDRGRLIRPEAHDRFEVNGDRSTREQAPDVAGTDSAATS